MNKHTRWNIKITVLSLLLALVCSCVTSCDGKQGEPDYGILLAVPGDAGIIIKSSDVCRLSSALSDDCQIWAQISSMPRLREAARAVKTLDSIARDNHAVRMALKDKSAMVSFHREGDKKVVALIGVQIDPHDHKTLMDNLAEQIRRQGLSIQRLTYDKAIILLAVDPNNKNTPVFFMTYTDGYFMVSTSRLTVEEAVRHIHSKNTSMKEDKALKRLLASAGKDATAVLIFNYKRMCDMFSNDISKSAFAAISGHSNWSVLDISVQKQVVTCAGYTDCNKASQTACIIRSQKPVPNSCPEYLPSKTTSFISLGISDMHLFSNDFKNHLQSAGRYGDFDANNERIRKSYGVNFAELLYTNLTGRITEFSCTYSLAERGNDHYVIAELKDADQFEKEMVTLCKKYREKEKITDKNGIVRIKTSKGNQYLVYKFPIKHTFNSYFGELFAAESEYMMIYGGRAVFGKTINALYEYANNIDNERTLANNSIYNNFSDYVNGESNLFYYADIAYSQEEIRKCLSSKNATDVTNNFSKLNNIRSLALQYSHQEQDLYYTNAALIYDPTTEAERLVTWITQTDTTIRGKPQVLSKHDTEDKDILVQDETYKLYLFSKTGKREFVKLIGEPITSPIYQIDYYGNNKKQYVFATEHLLHAIDRNGRYITENFPVKLPAPVSTEISVFDYDGTRDYRIFVPCNDRNLYIYTKEGVQLDSWTPFHTNEPLVSPVQFFRIDDSDYLVFADNLKTYIINRRGEVRINVTNSFPKARNSLFYLEHGEGMETRFVTSNSSGEIKYIYTDGSCKSKTFKNLSADHYFVLKDIDGDGVMEYIFTDQDMLYVYRENGSEKFSHCFDSSVGRPNIFKFSANDVRIGVTCRGQKQLFLFDNKGNICRGFPLQGTSEFSITRLDRNAKFSLLAGNSDNYLYNYQIQ